MREVFICDAARTAIGRYGGALAKVRTDDLAAVPIRALVARNAQADWSRLDEVFLGLRPPAAAAQAPIRERGKSSSPGALIHLPFMAVSSSAGIAQ